ncbi:hypothetical protein G7Y89_g5178 [Cudoniella acicularis]|uniref:Integral membrane protein n=1 Tax=Cudoniella acicularis TaxID=354080 RepID=A0A8H4RQ18_9HELO|nr:hypothetical protein G7Y89_g5178 [Cudoniella acicularis]
MSDSIQIPSGPLPPNYLTESRAHILISVGVLFMVLDITAFGLRAISRRIKRVSFGWDDVLIIPALIFNLVLDVLLMLMIPYGGVGHHTLVTALDDPGKFVFLSKASLLITPILYICAVNLSKGAIVQLFLRIFTLGWTRHVAHLIGVILIAQTIAIVFTVIFQCKPVSLIWTTAERGSCIDTQEFFAYTSIPNVITDFAMLVLPLPTIWNMKATVQLKIGVTITLLTASIGIITSILRTIGFFTIPLFKDPTWLNVTVFAYSIAEPGTYFLAACFPTYRPLIWYVRSERLLSTSYWLRSKKYGDITRSGDSGQGYTKQTEQSKGTKRVVHEESIALAEGGESVFGHDEGIECTDLEIHMEVGCKSDKVRPIDSAAFSIAMSDTEARLYISWKHNELDYYMRKVKSFSLQEPEKYVEFRKHVPNIIDWGKDKRLNEIRDSLNSLLEESRQTASQLAKSRPPPSSDDPARSSSQKRKSSLSRGRNSKAKTVQEYPNGGINTSPSACFHEYNQDDPFVQIPAADDVYAPPPTSFPESDQGWSLHANFH